jgi:hypothetical protein
MGSKSRLAVAALAAVAASPSGESSSLAAEVGGDLLTSPRAPWTR